MPLGKWNDTIVTIITSDFGLKTANVIPSVILQNFFCNLHSRNKLGCLVMLGLSIVAERMGYSYLETSGGQSSNLYLNVK
jgi:hypothetical protein